MIAQSLRNNHYHSKLFQKWWLIKNSSLTMYHFYPAQDNWEKNKDFVQ